MGWIWGSEVLHSILMAREEGVQHHSPVKNWETGRHAGCARAARGKDAPQALSKIHIWSGPSWRLPFAEPWLPAEQSW